MGAMSAEPPPDVQPIGLKWLVALALGTFVVVFLVSEVIDPRWIGAFRSAAAPTAVATPVARLVRPLPTPRGRAATTPQPAGQAGAAAGEPSGPAGEGSEAGESPPTSAVVAETGGSGARLRAGPSAQAAVLEVLEEGTTVELAGQDVEAEGRRWVEVRVPNGLSGWVAGDFLAMPEPTPGP
jgi:hypothetical protein